MNGERTPIADEQLMAYADGELEGLEREAVEHALAADPALAARVERMTALRTRLQQGLAAELDAPVPERLESLLRGERPAAVIDLGAARAARRSTVWTSWQAWGGMAASLVLGVLIAQFGSRGQGGDGVRFEQYAGALVARGAVERALSQALASESGDGTVSVQLSFLDKTGAYCRTFTLDRSAGLACREGGAWTVQALAEAQPQTGAMRQAASALPAAVLSAVDRRIEGGALDASAERAARDRGWQR